MIGQSVHIAYSLSTPFCSGLLSCTSLGGVCVCCEWHWMGSGLALQWLILQVLFICGPSTKTVHARRDADCGGDDDNRRRKLPWAERTFRGVVEKDDDYEIDKPSTWLRRAKNHEFAYAFQHRLRRAFFYTGKYRKTIHRKLRARPLLSTHKIYLTLTQIVKKTFARDCWYCSKAAYGRQGNCMNSVCDIYPWRPGGPLHYSGRTRATKGRKRAYWRHDPQQVMIQLCCLVPQ